MFSCYFLGFIVVYLRFRLVKELNRDADQILRRVNDISLVVGLFSALGLSIVGNFQVNKQIKLQYLSLKMLNVNVIL